MRIKDRRRGRVDEHDSEALFVLASPKDVGTYLRLHDLFMDIQKELDLSWAVLGEVFSRQDGLDVGWPIHTACHH